MSKVTIKDIARIARVSVGTVDRVLHNRGEVSSQTRKMVEEVITEYNYMPDILASNLASRKAYRFAVVMPDTVNDHVFWELPKKGIEEAKEEVSHFNLSVDFFRFSQTDKADFVSRVRTFPFKKFGGILFAPVFFEESKSFIRRANAHNIPVVLFNSVIEGAEYESYVGQDAFKSGYLAGKLMSFGIPPLSNLLLINLSARTDNYSHIMKREDGFRHYFEDHPGKVRNLITSNLSGAGDEQLLYELAKLMREYDPAGIFVTNSRVHKVAGFLSMNGLMNIRLIGYDLLRESREFLKREYIDFLISQKPEEQAKKGLISLVNLCYLNKKPDKEQLIPLDIITKENIEFYK